MTDRVGSLISRAVDVARSYRSQVGAMWDHLSLVARFVITTTAVMSVCMIVLGTWISTRIEDGVVRNTAVTTAFYMDSYVEPLIQALGFGPYLPEPAAEALDRVFNNTPLGSQIAGVEIWSKLGVIVYSNRKQVIGSSPHETEGYQRAIRGEVFSELGAQNNARVSADPNARSLLLDIYAPMHKIGTNEVIAVAEFHLFADKLSEDIQWTRIWTGLVVALISGLMLAALYRIVKEGNTTISDQRDALETRVAQLSASLVQNEALRKNLFDTRQRVVATNESVMRRIGADLHDGPAQLVGLALLRMNEIEPGNPNISMEDMKSSYDVLGKVLEDSLDEIRSISYGIAPPELEDVTLPEAIELAVRNHEKRTGTKVECDVGDIPDIDDCLIKICIYRFTQESLSNALRHAAGVGQRVEARYQDDRLEIKVSDRGPGFNPSAKHRLGGLGLAGLRDRIESLGGTFEIHSALGSGSCLVATFAFQ